MAVAAYAALVSLMHVLDNVKHPSRHRLHLDRNQIETLREKVSSLQDFLEVYSQKINDEIEGLARQMADVAIEAEYIIDYHVVDQLREKSEDKRVMGLSSFCQNIDKVIENFDSIKKELLMVKEEMALQLEQRPRVSVAVSSSAPPSTGKNKMVGFDKELVRIINALREHTSGLQIVSIVGMGGSGKTTLARNVFDNPYIVDSFRIRIWCTISQEFSVQEILLSLLSDIGVLRKEEKPNENLAKLGERLYKNLFGRRYLIVMDDVWSIKVWDDLKSFFLENGNASRVMVTTRLSDVAVSLGSQNPFMMNFLNEDNSWSLFCGKIFSQDGCPHELEEIGKKIAISCRGLPLAIVVIGGLLANSSMTRDYWEFVAENVNSFANSGDDEHCLKILLLSYSNLPIHLKPCFLHMRVFPEDSEITISQLVKFWVAEGFLKPIRAKSLEEVAKDYLKDLIDRNLILIRKWGHAGKIKTCGIHDLLRDLCLRESDKVQIFSAPKVQRIPALVLYHYKDTCFLCCNQTTSTRIDFPEVLLGSQSTSLSSRFVCDDCRIMYLRSDRLRLVRVIDTRTSYHVEEFPQPTTLRYLETVVQSVHVYPSTIHLLWNLQTLCIKAIGRNTMYVPSEIWEMAQLRHILINCANLPDPMDTQIERKNCTILENLHTLSDIVSLRLTEEVLKRIPNLKKLALSYVLYGHRDCSYYCFYNLAHLHKLESLSLELYTNFYRTSILPNIIFPHSLKKLNLSGWGSPWEEMTIIGSLPNLEVLKMRGYPFQGPEWNPVEGEFLRLKFLLIGSTDLARWRADCRHFPSLEYLVLANIKELEEIPIGIGEIMTLHSIQLIYCSNSVINSARQILEQQQSFGNEDFKVYVEEFDSAEYQLGASSQ